MALLGSFAIISNMIWQRVLCFTSADKIHLLVGSVLLFWSQLSWIEVNNLWLFLSTQRLILFKAYFSEISTKIFYNPCQWALFLFPKTSTSTWQAWHLKMLIKHYYLSYLTGGSWLSYNKRPLWSWQFYHTMQMSKVLESMQLAC